MTTTSSPLYSIATWSPQRQAFTPHKLSVPTFNITRRELVIAMRELRKQGYQCHYLRNANGDHPDNDTSVLIERTDGKHWKLIRRDWNRF